MHIELGVPLPVTGTVKSWKYDLPLSNGSCQVQIHNFGKLRVLEMCLSEYSPSTSQGTSFGYFRGWGGDTSQY